MKIQIDGRALFSISDLNKKIIFDYISEETIEEDLKSRFQWIVEEICKSSLSQLMHKWDPIISDRVGSVPSHLEKYADLVFSQPDYKDKRQRDADEKAERESTFKVV